MSRRPLELSLDALGDLSLYSEEELHDLREKLIDDLSRIDAEYRQADKRIKDFNVRKQELTEQRADRGRALRAIRNQAHTRGKAGRLSPPRGHLRWEK